MTNDVIPVYRDLIISEPGKAEEVSGLRAVELGPRQTIREHPLVEGRASNGKLRPGLRPA
jgi:hypothetical protein